MAQLHDRFRDKLAALFEAEGVPVKSIFVGRSGTLTITLYGKSAAEDVAGLIHPFARVRGMIAGMDPGVTTGVHNGRPREVRVWRVHAALRG